jgi:hypothetical protein
MALLDSGPARDRIDRTLMQHQTSHFFADGAFFLVKIATENNKMTKSAQLSALPGERDTTASSKRHLQQVSD